MKKSLFLGTDILCFAGGHWDIVYKRSQHLMSRFGQKSRVYYIEQPVMDSGTPGYTLHRIEGTQVQRVVFHLPVDSNGNAGLLQRNLLEQLIRDEKIKRYLCWYSHAGALAYSGELQPWVTVFDYLPDIAHPSSLAYETILFEKAEVIFVTGYHLFESVRHLHKNIYCFPNSIDKAHFHTARYSMEQPPDQASIPHPRIGFCGTIDERIDTELLLSVAAQQPGWQFILIGPVVNVDTEIFHQQSNIHLLEAKQYAELPQYFSGWDVAMIPFSATQDMQDINPASLLEYLAAGKPVVATPLYDIVHPYGKKGLVNIANSRNNFIDAIEKALRQGRQSRWLAKVDRALETMSWDKTFRHMEILVEAEMERKRKLHRAATGFLVAGRP